MKCGEDLKFRLVEGSPHHMSPALNRLLKSFMGDTTKEYAGQTALKIYLCTNRRVVITPNICVHHIDGDHNNFRDENLALLDSGEHHKLHNDCKETIMEEIEKELYTGGPGRISLDDLSPDIEKKIKDRYVQLLKDRVNLFRKDN